MTVELKKDGYAELEQGIQKIESLAVDSLYNSHDLGDMVRGYLRVMHEVRKLRQTLRNAALMVPDAPPATTGDKGAAA
jgi:hypothetical protein